MLNAVKNLKNNKVQLIAPYKTMYVIKVYKGINERMKIMKKLLKKMFTNFVMSEKSQTTPSSDTSCHLLPPMGRRQFSFGFTLAEVLITLGIIGVVAALTLPSLIAKYDEMVTMNKIKRSYSEIINAVEMRKQELGSSDYKDMFDPSVYTAEEMLDGIAKYLNVVERCKIYDRGCGGKYAIKFGIKVNDGYGKTSSNSYFYNERVLLNDGTIMAVSSLPWSGNDCSYEYRFLAKDENGNAILDADNKPTYKTSTSRGCASISFDVDGVKGKNQYGYDNYKLLVMPAKLSGNSDERFGNIFKTMRTGKFDYEKYQAGDF